MKKLIFAALVAAVGTTFAVDVPPGPDTRVRTPNKDKVSGIIKRNGGFVCTPTAGKSVRIVNGQKKLDRTALEKVARSIASRLGWKVEVVDDLKDDGNSGCIISVTEKEGARAILVAPENDWAEVNVTPLAADKPDVEKLSARAEKEVWRALCFVMGAANSKYQPCLMRDIRSLADLDAAVAEPCPEPFNAMNDEARARGFSSQRRTTYRRACAEGWAPEPKDDIQRAIWEEYHTKPSKPMEIKYDKKLGK